MNFSLGYSVAGRAMLSPIIFALMLSTQGCSSASDTAARKAAEAAALLDQGNAPAARLAAAKAVAERDDIADYWRLLGRAELQSNNFAGAYDAYSRAIELDAADPESLQMLADIALRAGRTRDAVKAADQLLSLQPALMRPRLVKGMAALIDGDEKTAERLANEILATDPNDEVGRVLKSRVMGRRGDFAAGIAILDNAATARTEIALTTLGELYRGVGNGVKLAEILRELNGINFNQGRLFDLAAVEYKLGKHDVARATLLKSLQSRPADLAFHDRAYDFLVEYDPGIFDAGPAALPDKPDILLRMLAARVLLDRGKPQQAQAVLEPLIGASTPQNVWALYVTATHAQGKPGAEKILAGVLAVDATNEDALLLRSGFARQRGDFASALRDAQQVLHDDPDNVRAKLTVIGLYRVRGDRARARQLFEELLQKHPESTVALRAYIGFLVEVKDRARVQSAAQGFTLLNPARIDGWKIRQQLCDSSTCMRDSAAGLEKASTIFTPPDNSDVKRAGILGRL